MAENHEAGSELRIPILVYHQVASDREKPPDTIWARDYTFVSDFELQMQYLADHGFMAVTHDQVYHWLTTGARLPASPVMISFDDARRNVLENAYPMLQSHGWQATVYVITALADGLPVRGHTLKIPTMSWDELAVLRDAGWVIGSHTRNHLYLKGAQWGRETNVELLYELLASRREIERNLGVIPQYFAYPGGLWSPLAEKLVARVYRSARSWIWRGKYPYCDRHTNPYRLPGMNISFHLSFEDFKKLVNYTEPSYQYQWDNNWIGGEKGLVGRLASRLRR